MNERLIYEWLRPHLPEENWQWLDEDGALVWARVVATQVMEYQVLPPLDMNTAFSEGIPKLTKEGCDVKFTHGAWDLQPMRKPWHGPYHARSDFWLAVDECLEAK